MKRIQITLRIETHENWVTGATLSEMVRNILIDELPIDMTTEHIVHEVWESENDS